MDARATADVGIGTVAKLVVVEKLAEHEKRCSAAKQVRGTSKRLNYIFGALMFLSAMVPVAVWALNRMVTRQDQLVQAVNEVRVLVERVAAERSKVAQTP